LGRRVKCRACLQLDDKEKMIYEDNMYFHAGKCHNDFLKHKKFKAKELKAWDKLYRYILNLHGIIILPRGNIYRLQKLRNGVEIINGKEVQRYKKGVPYQVMLLAYQLAEKDIKWAIKNRLNGSVDVKAINYCISIMMNKINEAFNIIKQKKEHEQKVQEMKRETFIGDMSLDYKKQNINKKDDKDISDFL